MKKISKKIMALILSLVMILGCIPCNIANANEKVTFDMEITFELGKTVEEIADTAKIKLNGDYVTSDHIVVNVMTENAPYTPLDPSTEIVKGKYKVNLYYIGTIDYRYDYTISGTFNGEVIENWSPDTYDHPTYNHKVVTTSWFDLRETISQLVLIPSDSSSNLILGNSMPNLNPVCSKETPTQFNIFDGLSDDEGWYTTPECDGAKCSGVFQKDTTYYYKRHYTILSENRKDYVFADSISIDFYNNNIQYELISDTADSEYIHTLIIKVIPVRRSYSLKGTETLNDLNISKFFGGPQFDYYPISGHRGVYYVVFHFTDALDLYGSIKFKGDEYINNIKTSKPSDEDIFNEKCFIIDGDPGFDAYYVYDWSKIENITFTGAPDMTVADVLASVTFDFGSPEYKGIHAILDGAAQEMNLQDTDKLEAGKKYKLRLVFKVQNEYDYISAVNVNGDALAYKEDLSIHDDGWETYLGDNLGITYTFECKNPLSGGSSKKYKATDSKDTTIKISGTGKKGSKRIITPEPNRKVQSVIVIDKDGNKYEVKNEGDGTYSFIQPGTDVDVEVKYKNRIIELTIGSLDASVDDVHHNLDVVPKVVNDRTMLPIRFVAENLGAKVDWDEKAPNTVIITRGDTRIEITLGSDKAKVNGQEYILDSVAFAENDRTYLPVRFVSEKLNAIVEWNEAHPMDVKIYERQ